jgi:YidC/Oxa1 family membrane protein insertase
MDTDQKRAFYAVVVSGIILFGWQYFFAPAPVQQSTNITTTSSGNVSIPVASDTAAVATGTTNTLTQNQSFELVNGKFSATLDSTLAIRNFVHTSSVFSFDEIVGNQNPFAVQLNANSRLFTISKINNNKLEFVSETIKGSVELSDRGDLNFSYKFTDKVDLTFQFNSSVKKLENGQERFFVYLTNSYEQLDIDDEETIDASVRWLGVDFNYHLFAITFPQKTQSILHTSGKGDLSALLKSVTGDFNYRIVFLKKEYSLLTSFGDNLHLAVDFGIWSIFAEWILFSLQWLYNFIPNYGIGIIFLTFVIRLLTFPLQFKSFKSMKKMQIIQPELAKIREKFKDDPQRLQKESMDLFKRAGANPLGGCLPLLLQMPIFFAFYKVLYSAVELVNAPFYFWIVDLSNKDPYYILPLLMTGSMFLQQKMTPNTITDPIQKKMMMFMPLIFGVIMKDLPSGLSLYIFVSTMLGIIQQMIVFKRIN